MKRFLFFIPILMFIAGCTAVNSVEPLSQANGSDEELAIEMMQIYPDDEVEYQIIGEQFVQGGEKITFEFIDVPPNAIENFTIMGEVISPNGSSKAFEACNPDKCQSRLFIKDLKTEEIFEITFSLRMNWRPLSNLDWIDDQVFAFGQGSNPHFGFRFAIDAQYKEHLLTLMVVDKCFAENNCAG